MELLKKVDKVRWISKFTKNGPEISLLILSKAFVQSTETWESALQSSMHFSEIYEQKKKIMSIVLRPDIKP